MKKKFLSLMMAAAVVATTSVSAFADDTTISSYKEGSNTANVTIKGSVYGNDGEIPSGTISVSVPTALNFKVNKEGVVEGSSIKIVNNGAEAVDVSAVSFVDETPNSGITVKSPQDLSNVSEHFRNEVVLNLIGKSGEGTYFKTVNPGNGKSGIIDSQGASQESTGIKLSTIEGNGNSDTLTLSGIAGTKPLEGDKKNEGLTDKFILTLKIAKTIN